MQCQECDGDGHITELGICDSLCEDDCLQDHMYSEECDNCDGTGYVHEDVEAEDDNA